MSRRAAALVGLGAAAALFGSASGALAGPLAEPVTVTASAPARVAPGAPFKLTVEVAADPGALDIAAQPLRLRVRLAPECGGSFAGTEGPTAIDRVLPAPTPGAAYAAKASGEATIPSAGEVTICAFLEDAQERQYATDTEAVVTVGSGTATGPGCKAARTRAKKAHKRSRKIDHRIHTLRRRAKRTHGASAHRRIEGRLRKLRKKRHRANVRALQARKRAIETCAPGRRA